MKKLIYLILAFTLIAAGCGQSKKDKEMDRSKNSEFESTDKPKMDSISGGGSSTEMKEQSKNSDYLSSSAAVQNPKDTARKFVRTADLKFKVKNVYDATLKIEKIAAENEGFVTYTNLHSTIDKTILTPISADSSLESLYYSVENNIVLRVPNYKLDSTIRSIAPLIQYLDYRIIKADDVSMLLLSNKIAQKTLSAATQKLGKVNDEKAKNYNQAVNSEENLLNKQRILDQLKLSNLGLLDEINYSTLKINIYQRQEFKRELIENDKNIKSYKAGFWVKLKEAVMYSVEILLNIFLFLVRIWAIILIIVVIIIILKRFVFNDKPKR